MGHYDGQATLFINMQQGGMVASIRMVSLIFPFNRCGPYGSGQSCCQISQLETRYGAHWEPPYSYIYYVISRFHFIRNVVYKFHNGTQLVKVFSDPLAKIPWGNGFRV